MRQQQKTNGKHVYLLTMQFSEAAGVTINKQSMSFKLMISVIICLNFFFFFFNKVQALLPHLHLAWWSEVAQKVIQMEVILCLIFLVN